MCQADTRETFPGGHNGVHLVSGFLRGRLENKEHENKHGICIQYKLFPRCRLKTKNLMRVHRHFHQSPRNLSVSILKTTCVTTRAVLLTKNAFVFSSGLMVLVQTEWNNHGKSQRLFLPLWCGESVYVERTLVQESPFPPHSPQRSSIVSLSSTWSQPTPWHHYKITTNFIILSCIWAVRNPKSLNLIG